MTLESISLAPSVQVRDAGIVRPGLLYKRQEPRTTTRSGKISGRNLHVSLDGLFR